MSLPDPISAKKQVMIVAGEASGDMHGARLVEAMQQLQPDLHISGIGGSELASAGVQMLYDASKLAVVGITEVISHLGDILAARKALIGQMYKIQPALLILIDYPDFNLLLAAKAKKLGIPVFYYISPQVWAWRSGRVKKIGRLTNRVAVILPFEKNFYATRGVDVDFVGHPLVDTVKTCHSKKDFFQSQDVKIVSDGDKILLSSEEAGDEPYLLADNLSNTGVIVGGNRVKTGQIAIDKLGAEVIILDDGFQHWRLQRDLDIVVIDCLEPFGKKHLLPHGFLREPLRNLCRADVFVLSRIDQIDLNELVKIKDAEKTTTL